MQKTPNAMRKQIAILGNTNAGKSTLFNQLTGQDNAIVSPRRGTTTDPVQKAMELIPYGPVVLWDTAGMEDGSELGEKRMDKTLRLMRRLDAAIYLADAASFPAEGYREFQASGLDHVLVLGKSDLAGTDLLRKLKKQYPDALEYAPGRDITELRDRLMLLLQAQEDAPQTILGGLLPPGSHVVLVIPIDSEAPRGRVILPQVQVLRDCLDNHILSTSCQTADLPAALEALGDADLVITDSQAFREVDAATPPNIPITSFSMLLARQTGRFSQLLAGASAIKGLQDGNRILMLEGCTHNHTHEDIGRVKIPALLKQKTGRQLEFQYYSGYDFPGDLAGYRMAVMCGSCMLNRREVLGRLDLLDQAGIPVTNYGILLSALLGILDRCQSFFEPNAD